MAMIIKELRGEVWRGSEDHSAAAYLKVISLQSFPALLPPRAPLGLLKLWFMRVSPVCPAGFFCFFFFFLFYFEWRFASCPPSSWVLLCKIRTLESDFLADACMIAYSWPFLVHRVCVCVCGVAPFFNLYPGDIWAKRSGCRPVHP